MSKTKRSFLTLGAVSLLGVVTIAGCGNNANTTANSGSSSSGPYSFSISMPSEDTYLSTSPGIQDDPYVKKLEQLTNTTIKFNVLSSQNGFAKSMDILFASGNLPNVVATSSSGGFGSSNGVALGQALKAGEFLPLNDLIDKYGPNLKKFIPQDAWNEETYNGKIYGIPQFITVPQRAATYIRMDLLQQTGLPVPKTVDDMLNVLRAFKKLGVAQPYDGRQNFAQMDTFFGAYDVLPSSWTVDTNGKPVPNFFHVPNMESALQAYKTMYDEGLMSKEFLTQTKVQYTNAITTGKAGIFMANADNLIDLQNGLAKNVPGAKLAIIPSPVGPDGKGGYSMVDQVTRAFMITKQTQNPEKIIQFLNWMLTPDAQKFFVYGLEGTDYTIDSSGKINYDPQTQQQINAEGFRSWLWMIQDNTYNAYTPEQLQASSLGQVMLKDFNDIISKEGRETIRWNPPLTSLDANPTLNINGQIAPLLLEAMGKMVVGSEPISDWPKIVQQWRQQGGDQELTEAAKAYQNKAYYDLRAKLNPIPAS